MGCFLKEVIKPNLEPGSVSNTRELQRTPTAMGGGEKQLGLVISGLKWELRSSQKPHEKISL